MAIRLVLAIVFVVFAFNRESMADIIFELSGDLALINGSDLEGLDGATFVHNSVYDNDEPYEDFLNAGQFPIVRSTSASMTVSGSSITANNGIYGYNSELAFAPTLVNYITPFDGDFVRFTLGTGTIVIDRSAQALNPAPGAADALIGGAIELDDFLASPAFGIQSINGSNYNFVNIQVTATKVIPEPTAVGLLFCAALSGLRFRRRDDRH